MGVRRGPTTEAASWVDREGRIDASLLLPELPSEVAFGCLGRLMPTSLVSELRLQLHRIPAPRAL